MMSHSMFFRIDDRVTAEEWNTVADRTDGVCWWWRHEWLQYALAYTGGIDKSFVVMNEQNQIVAVQPLIIAPDKTFTFGAQHPIPWAVVGNTIGPEEGGLIASIIRTRLTAIGLQHGIASMRIAAAPRPEATPMELPDWMEAVDYKTRVVDLQLDVQTLWRDLRESYQGLISKAAKECDIISGPSIFLPYKVLHRQQVQRVGGKERAERTYQLQEHWLSHNFARLYAVTKGGRLIAFAYWLTYKGYAYYMSGTSEEDNCQHYLLWHSLLDLKAHGVKYAELGWQGVGQTQKEQNIEFFKRGFGGTDWHVPSCRMYFLTSGAMHSV